jgi:hypothetical protein
MMKKGGGQFCRFPLIFHPFFSFRRALAAIPDDDGRDNVDDAANRAVRGGVGVLFRHCEDFIRFFFFLLPPGHCRSRGRC